MSNTNLNGNVWSLGDFDDSSWSQQQWQDAEKAARKDYIEQRLSELVIAQIAQQPKLTSMNPGVRRKVISDMVEIASEIMSRINHVAERL